MSAKSFLKSRYFWIHFGLMVGATVILIWLTLLFLRLFTFHGESIDVPDFSGKTMEEIQEMPEARHYDFIVVDSIYDNTKEKGTILTQTPFPGSKVKKGRNIYLTMVAMEQEKTKMPNLLDLTARQATAILETYGLKVGQFEYVPDVGQTVMRAKVNGKAIAWGDPIVKGTKVDLVVGRGTSKEMAFVPKLVGKSRKDAHRLINEAGLNVGSEVFANKSDTVRVRVVKQSPAFGKDAEINLGTSIDLWYE